MNVWGIGGFAAIPFVELDVFWGIHWYDAIPLVELAVVLYVLFAIVRSVRRWRDARRSDRVPASGQPSATLVDAPQRNP